MDKRQNLLGMAASFLACLFFGFSFLATKESVGSVSVFSLLAWRFFMAFVLMNVLVLLRVFKLDLRGKRLWPLLSIAIFQPIIYFLGETYGISLTTVSESGTLTSCIPLVTLLFSSLLLKEKPTRLQLISIVVSVCGMTLIGLAKGLEASFNLLGYLLLITAMVADAFFVIFSRKASSYTSVEKTYIMTGLGMAVFCACALVEHGLAGTVGEFISLPFKDTGFLLSVLYLSAGCSVAAFVLSNYSIAVIGPNRMVSFAGITTVVSVLAGVLILDENFSIMQGIGTGLVLLGVYGANILPRGAEAVPSPESGK